MYIYVGISIYVYVCMYVCIYTLVTCMCVYVCTYVCVWGGGGITHYDAFKILNPATHNKKYYHRLTVKTNKKNPQKRINKLYDSVLTQLSFLTKMYAYNSTYPFEHYTKTNIKKNKNNFFLCSYSIG